MELKKKKPKGFQKGNTFAIGNKHCVGLAPWNKGKKGVYTEEALRKMSLKKKGVKPSEKTLVKLRLRKGKKAGNYKDGRSKNKKYLGWIKNKRNRLKKSSLGSHTFAEWELLKKQYGNTCPSCHRMEPHIKLTEDHVIPLSKGGSDFIENIQPLCQSCNSKKNAKIIKYENNYE